MSQTLVSSVPGVFLRLEFLLKQAAEAQEPQIPVFPFALGEYEPSGYVFIEKIEQDPYEWETIGSFSQKEVYDICGTVSTFTGDSPFTNPSVVTSTMERVYAMMQQIVMEPVMSNRDMPILGTPGPSPYLMIPSESKPEFGVATASDGPAGWFGQVKWSFHFEAILTPS